MDSKQICNFIEDTFKFCEENFNRGHYKTNKAFILISNVEIIIYADSGKQKIYCIRKHESFYFYEVNEESSKRWLYDVIKKMSKKELSFIENEVIGIKEVIKQEGL